MQDEVTKHAKKIYKTAKDPQHTFGEKVKDIIIEICIIVFAVTLSIWLHSWSEHRQEQKEAAEFLKGLKGDLYKDIKLLEANKNSIARINSNFKFILSLKNDHKTGTLKDTAIYDHLEFSTPVSHLNIGRYDGFKSSGKIGTIENDSLKENILVFYQQTLPELGYSENFINSLQLKILDLEIDKSDKTPIRDFVTTVKLRSLFGLGVHNSEVSIKEYEWALKQAKKIIEEIDKEAK
jgi:hypothetical protein